MFGRTLAHALKVTLLIVVLGIPLRAPAQIRAVPSLCPVTFTTKPFASHDLTSVTEEGLIDAVRLVDAVVTFEPESARA